MPTLHHCWTMRTLPVVHRQRSILLPPAVDSLGRDHFRLRQSFSGSSLLVVSFSWVHRLPSGWVRSHTYADEISYSFNSKTLERLMSSREGISWTRIGSDPPTRQEFSNGYEFGQTRTLHTGFSRNKCKWQLCGFGFDDFYLPGFLFNPHYVVYVIPYWSIVIQRTLVSAYLLLVKPRRPKSGPTHV